MKTLLFVFAVSFIAFGCQSTSSNSTKPIVNIEKPTPAAVLNNSNIVANSGNANSNTSSAQTDSRNVVKNFPGRGIVTKIDLELVSVEMNHEEIKGLMPAMTMEFYAKDKKQLEVLKVGDKVDFNLEDKAGAELITDIKKSK
jgi:Cu/Ag efflux protein CusF